MGHCIPSSNLGILMTAELSRRHRECWPEHRAVGMKTMNFGGSVYISITQFTKCEIILFLASMEGPEIVFSWVLTSSLLLKLQTSYSNTQQQARKSTTWSGFLVYASLLFISSVLVRWAWATYLWRILHHENAKFRTASICKQTLVLFYWQHQSYISRIYF